MSSACSDISQKRQARLSRGLIMKERISKYIKQYGAVQTEFGSVKITGSLGEGGCGLVYEGLLLDREVAIKFLTTDSVTKLARFKEEYVLTRFLPNNPFLAQSIHFESIDLSGVNVYCIIMTRYEGCLKRDAYRAPKKDEVVSLFNFLLKSIEFIHDNKVIHRDIKPENILLKNGKYYLSDFGIAHYDEDLQRLAKTAKGDRLANFSFSAPEQAHKGYSPSASSDLYAMAQVVQWFVTGSVHKGTRRVATTNFIDGIDDIDSVIDLCLVNDPSKRFQSVGEIREHIKTIARQRKEPRRWDVILDDFRSALLATFPKRDSSCVYTSDNAVITRLLKKLASKDFREDEFWYIRKGGGDMYTSISYFKDNFWFLPPYEIEVESIYAHIHRECDDYDVIVLNIKKSQPFENANAVGGHSRSAAFVKGIGYITTSEAESGYIENIKGEPVSIEGMEVTYRERFSQQTSIVLCSRYHGVFQKEFQGTLQQFLNNIQPDGSSLEAFKYLTKEALFGVLHPTVLEWR